MLSDMLLNKPSRSHRRFEKNLDARIGTHQKKLDNGLLSLAPHEGKLAILPSRGTTAVNSYSPTEQIRIFREEAETIADSEFAKQYDTTEVMPAVNKLDVDMALADFEVSGVVLIGHGTIAALRLHQDKYMNWYDASRATKQLKLGHFVQRMCGGFGIYESVPLGTFVVADQRNVLAAVGMAVDDLHPDDSLFAPVFDKPVNSFDDIVALRDKHYTHPSDR